MTFNINNNIIQKPAEVSDKVWDTFVQEFNHTIAAAQAGQLFSGDWDRPVLDTDLIEALQDVLSCLHSDYHYGDPCPNCGGRLVVEEDSAHCLDCDHKEIAPNLEPDPDAAYEQECDRAWEASAHADSERDALIQFSIELQNGGEVDDLDAIAW